MTEKTRCEERIEKLLEDLRYEITRGMMQRQLPGETFMFAFLVPVSKALPGGVVLCKFETRPVLRSDLYGLQDEPKLRVVK